MKCIVCGKEFEAAHGNRRICSATCRELRNKQREKNRKREPAPLIKKVCPQCGKTFTTTREFKKFCTRECWRAFFAPKRVYERACAFCGKTFTANQITAKYCSRSCKSKSYYKRKADNCSKSPVKKTCKYCGKEFNTSNSRQEYCSITCRRKVEAVRYNRIGHRANKMIQYQVEPQTVPRPKPTVVTAPKPKPKPQIIIPAAVTENRKPTVNELLDWIFDKEARHSIGR